MVKQTGEVTAATFPQHPTTNDRAAWSTYWQACDQKWRIEPEIDIERQEYLDDCCTKLANIKQSIYPFKDIKLSRADLEWLLLLYMDETGCVSWDEQYGLDLRGAELSKTDLRGLPLKGIRCGLRQDEWVWLQKDARIALTEDEEKLFTEEDLIMDEALPTVVRQRLNKLLEAAGANLEGADLRGVNLERSTFAGARMKGVWLSNTSLKDAYFLMAGLQHAMLLQANLEEAYLDGANLERAYLRFINLRNACLERACLTRANLEGAFLNEATLLEAHLEGARFANASLVKSNFSGVNLEDAYFGKVHAKGARFTGARLHNARFYGADLRGANFAGAHLEGASFCNAHLEDANLTNAHLEGSIVPPDRLEHIRKHTRNKYFPSVLPPSDLTGAFFNSTTNFTNAILGDRKHGSVSLADVHWDGVNISVIDWDTVKMLGDEREALQKHIDGEHFFSKEEDIRLERYRKAVRANRQISVVLASHGFNEEAAHFIYRSQRLQRVVLRKKKKVGQYLFSLFLDMFAGYGYKPWRSFLVYCLMVTIFATIYYLSGSHLTWNEAIVISMTAFHGRGFFPDQFRPGDPQALVAAIEAFVGLIIEVTLIATLTQRLFGK